MHPIKIGKGNHMLVVDTLQIEEVVDNGAAVVISIPHQTIGHL
jgi:hypothetical protein